MSALVRSSRGRRPGRGLGVVAVLMILVALSALAAAIVRTTRQAHDTLAQDVAVQRAQAAAEAGIQWGLWQVAKGGWTSCDTPRTQQLDLWTDNGAKVQVACRSQPFNEGESAPGTPRTIRVFTIDAIACNDAGGCPATGFNPQTYVERFRRVQVTD